MKKIWILVLCIIAVVASIGSFGIYLTNYDEISQNGLLSRSSLFPNKSEEAEFTMIQLSEELSWSVSESVTDLVAKATYTAAGNAKRPLKLGEKGRIQNWDITVNKIAVAETVPIDEYYYFQAETGNYFLQVFLKVKNISKEVSEFLPNSLIPTTLGDKVSAKITIDGKEYYMSDTRGKADNMMNQTLKPSASQNGVIYFEIPKKYADSHCKLTFYSEYKSIAVKLQ